MNRAVTLVVHGTYAAQAKWWRLGTNGEATFADRLEDELSRRGLSGTVWKPALAEGLDYSSFAWSGRNRHRHRIRGASGLSSSLNELAQRVAATPSEPLTVNFVAHSHGGNVVLEALRHLRPNVRVGRIALLGTPLVVVLIHDEPTDWEVRRWLFIERLERSDQLFGIGFALIIGLEHAALDAGDL